MKTKNRYLIVVNKDYPINEKVSGKPLLVPCLTFSRTLDKVEGKTFLAYASLYRALRKEGITIGLASAYRSVEQQRKIYDSFCRRYGEAYADATVAPPGTSEHHTGLAIDIALKADGKWLAENEDMMKETLIFSRIHSFLPRYGFILRYPKDKEEITGYPYEPWHFRYVGKKSATEITNSGLCLEEYIGECS